MMEETADSAREALDFLTQRAADCVLLWLDEAGCIIRWKGYAEPLWGHDGLKPGLPFVALFEQNPEQQLRCGETLQAARQQGDGYCAAEVISPTGTRVQVQVSCRASTTPPGGFLVVIRNESRFKQLSETFQKVVAEAPNAMLLVDAQGQIVLANLRALTLFGYDDAEMPGLSIESLVPERFQSGHGQLREHYLASPVARPMGGGRDLFGRRRDGGEFPVEIGLNPIEISDQRMVLVAVVDLTNRMLAQNLLEKALAEKTILLDEVHHRVKNNLQVIISLLNMQGRMVPDPSVRLVLEDTQTRVRSMALIHQLLYERHDFARVDLGEYVRRLTQLLGSSMGATSRSNAIDMQVTVEPVLIELQRATPCGLLTCELISNVFKHAYPNGPGSAEIRLTKTANDRACLVVADHGVGDVQLLERSGSLGLQLVPVLAEQMGATLAIESNAPGIRYTLHFSVLPEVRMP